MRLTTPRSLTPLALVLLACGADGASGGARIDTRLSSSAAAPTSITKFRSGAAVGGGLESLKYHVNSIKICETLETHGSDFGKEGNCVELYTGDTSVFRYNLHDDFTPLTEEARRSDDGFIDLLSESSRAQLAGSTALTHDHVRSYHYGIVTWALPIKVKATVTMHGATPLYTHDGSSHSELVGSDNYRAYYTQPSTSLSSAPAEEAVVLLPNGGNWFKFQSPFTITDADVDEQRAFVLDLVFNPDGIVKGFEGPAMGSLSERDGAGRAVRAITVPMLDLSPVPHRTSDRVMRESYQGPVTLDGNGFDLRLELYYVEGDESGTIYGVDAKSLVNAETTMPPPDLSKVSFLDRAADGTLSFSSWKHAPILTNFQRVTGGDGVTRVRLACATHADRAAAEGGAAIVVDRCPAPLVEVALALTARSVVEGSIPTAVGAGPDGGAVMAPMTPDAGS